MKRLPLSILLLFACFSLFAQTFREPRIFVPPVNGYSELGDNAFFYDLLNYNVVLQYYSIAKTQYASDFVLRGSISQYTGNEQFFIGYPMGMYDINDEGPVPQRPIPSIRNTFGRREFFSWETEGVITFFDTTSDDNYKLQIDNESVFYIENEEGDEPYSEEQEYVFTLELLSNKTGAMLAVQYIIYRYTDPVVAELVSLVVYNMLSNVPEIEADIDGRENWLFAGINALWVPRIYGEEKESYALVNFGIGVSLEYHFLDFLSVNSGVQVVQEQVITNDPVNKDFRDLILEIPLSLNFVFKPSIYMIEPYGGITLNLSLMNTTQPSAFSWFAGIQLGAKAGPGMILLDARFSTDFTPSYIPKIDKYYSRYLFKLGIGYKFGLLPKYPSLP